MSHAMKSARPAAILLLAVILVPVAACSLFPKTSSNPSATPTPIQIIVEPTYSPDIIFRQYEWEYDGRDWQWTLEVPQSLYDYYVERPRAPTNDYSIYVTHPEDDAYIDMVVERIEDVASEAGYDATVWSTFLDGDVTLEMVQSYDAVIWCMGDYQEADGSVTVPEALRPYMHGLERIEKP